MAPAELPRRPTGILRSDSQSGGQELSFEPNPGFVASEMGFVQFCTKSFVFAGMYLQASDKEMT